MATESAFKLYTDGGARGNPGPASIGIVLVDSSGNIIKQLKRFIGKATNNQAEYTALIEGLKVAKMYWKGSLECFVDSELVARQVNGDYNVKNTELRIAHKAVQKLMAAFPSVTITQVRRTNAMQSLADKLVNEALDENE